MLSEIRQIVENVAREKGIDLEIVYGALEEAYQKAGRSKYGYDYDIRATIDRRTGAVTLRRYREVREPDLIDNEAAQITLQQAKREKKDAALGEFLIDELPSFDYGRISAQTAKQVIVQKIRDAEREKQFDEFKDRVGEIISGVVKRVEYGNVTVDLGRAEAILRRDECIPRENIKNGDRIRAYIYDVRREGRGPQIFISRTHPGFMAALFTQEVPEIYEGLIEIKSVARDPGSRAKIAVYAREGSIDPVGACVGMRGSRVQAVVGELQGEKIDIVPWSTDFATFVVNALAPADVSKVVFDEDKKKLDVVVPDDQLSLAIGRRGQNVRLASILIGWDIDILTEEEESKRRAEEFRTKSALFIEALDVDEVIAQLLVAEGFKTVEEIVQEDVSELIRIEGFNEEVAAELQNRAQNWLTAKAEKFEAQKKALGIQEDLLSMEGLTQDQVITLAEKGVKSRDDLADLATDELVEILGAEQMSMQAAEKMIMAARAHWFADEENQDSADEAAVA
ncbi:MAG: transcription termination/antitermination protein NusA [Alphaproteobacteria bacterium]|nr:transcription termination/antitermination protein NusA [Alphaproteobacteria bacterium]